MDKNKFIECAVRIAPFIHKTPVLTSKSIDRMVGASLFFKCENFQKMGAFKIRGAMNAMLQLSDEQKKAGVVTHSSGNFAQALALAAQSLGVKVYIVMPSDSPKVKKNAVKDCEAHIIECEPTFAARESSAKKIVQTEGAVFIDSSNNNEVILGQGTVSKELLALYPFLEYIIVPVGGGGLIAGAALAAKYFGHNCKVVGGEPFEADEAYRSLQSGALETNTTTNTIADGLRTQLGDKNFTIMQREVDSVVRVTEQEIVYSMRIIWERLKIVGEPSCAVALAVVMKEKQRFADKKIGVVISGGNVDLDHLPF